MESYVNHDYLIVGMDNLYLNIQLELDSDELLLKYGLEYGKVCLA